jgi:RNA polymerase sigma-70 factor, ECF subfamily
MAGAAGFRPATPVDTGLNPRPSPLRRDAPDANGAFALAVSRLRPYLVRVARARLRDDALADDMVQDTLLAALDGGSAFRGEAALRTWLTAILLRRIADGMRQRCRWGPVPLAGTPTPDDAERPTGDGVAAHAEAIDWMDPQRRLEGRQLLDAFARHLETLAPTAARLLALRAFDGLDNDAAAQALGLSADKAALLLHRTRARLRRELGAAPRPPARRSTRAALHVG